MKLDQSRFWNFLQQSRIMFRFFAICVILVNFANGDDFESAIAKVTELMRKLRDENSASSSKVIVELRTQQELLIKQSSI